MVSKEGIPAECSNTSNLSSACRKSSWCRQDCMNQMCLCWDRTRGLHPRCRSLSGIRRLVSPSETGPQRWHSLQVLRDQSHHPLGRASRSDQGVYPAGPMSTGTLRYVPGTRPRRRSSRDLWRETTIVFSTRARRLRSLRAPISDSENY